ncbi:hypothetical protein CRG98_049656, partial [Punica granatum]
MCIHYIDLNKACPKDAYPLPRIDLMVDATVGHQLHGFMDAYSRYNEIRMSLEDERHTAFFAHEGVYYYKVMPFGLKNARATYRRLVDAMFTHHVGKNMEAYVDNMTIKFVKAGDH